MNDVTVQNCSMSLYYGAAVQVLGGTTTMNRCTFKNNIANEGGHIAVMNDSVLNMTECTMTEGKASQNGGAIYYNSSATQYGEISSSVIHANSAGSSGGGIYVASGNLIVNPTSKLYGNTAPTGEDMTALVTGQGSYTDNLETLNALFAEDNIRVIGLDWTQDPDTATKYYKLYYEEIVQEDPSDTEDTGDDTTEPGTDEPSTDTEDTGTDEEPSTPTEPSVPDDGDDGDQEEPTAPSQPGDSDQDSTKDPDAGDSEQDSTDNGGNTDNSSNNGNTTNTTENSGNTTNTDNSSNDNTTVDNSSNDVVTDNSDHSSIDNSQTDNSQTTTDNSDHSTTTNTSDNSSHDTNTTTTNNSSDNSSKTTTTDNSQRSEDNSSVVTTYNYYQNPENQSQVQQGQQMQPIVVNNYIQQPSQEGQQVEEADDPSNNIKIDAEGVDVVFEMVDGVYSISIKAVNEPQAVQTVQDAVVPASNQAAEPAFNVNWYEIIKIGLLVAILVNVMWKPRQNSPA